MKKIDHSKIIIGIIILIIIANIVFFVFLFQENALEKKINKNEQINILFTISDNNELLFSEIFLYNPVSNKGGLFYIPPNLGIKNESMERFDKILALYNSESLNDFKQELEFLMGISLPFVIDISLNNIGNIVDLLGGIEIFISNPVNSEYEGRKILLPSGSVVLDGDKVKIFTTFEESVDEEKSARKHRVIEGILAKISTTEINTFLLNENSFKYLKEYLNINFSDAALRTFILEMNNLNTEQLVFKSVLGNEKEIEGIEGMILFPFYEGELIKMNVKQLIETMSNLEISYVDQMNASIEILNGTNTLGLAKNVKILFESIGIAVNFIGNADNDQYENTIIIDKSSMHDAAERLADILKCGIIKEEFDAESDNDITIILGRDYNEEQ